MQPDNQFNYWQNDQPQPAPIAPPVPPVQPVAQPTPMPESQPPVAPVEMPDQAPLEMYEPDQSAPDDTAGDEQPDGEEPDDYTTIAANPIHWGATEYIYRPKSGLWFFIFAVILLGLIAADIFFFKTYTFAILVAVMGLAFIVYTRRPPQEINYSLSSSQGLYIGETLHSFDEYKSFGVINDRGNNFIKLIPVKRFGLGASVYFPTELGEQIVDAFGAVLPMEDLKLDAFDVVARTLRL